MVSKFLNPNFAPNNPPAIEAFVSVSPLEEIKNYIHFLKLFSFTPKCTAYENATLTQPENLVIGTYF